MIVWLNGTFGVGKTTVGTLLSARDSRLRMFDPEWVGYMVANNLTDHEVSDFQQLAPWRALTPLVADELIQFTGQHLVAAQSVLTQSYWHEISAGIRALGHDILHVLLDADRSAIKKRATEDQVEISAKDWRLKHLPGFERSRPWMTDAADVVIDTSSLTASDVADRVCLRLTGA